MSLAQSFLAEFEKEAVTTRKFLERVPENQLSWRPHEKSMTAGQLALHMASIPGNVLRLAMQDTPTPPDFGRTPPQPTSVKEILEALDGSIAFVRENLPTITDERLAEIWRLNKNGKEILAIPRAAVLRNILLNHWYHHRGQFGVYLRLLGANVPSAYGPSGDELPDFLKPAAA